MSEPVEQVAYQYGREVAWREYCSDMGNIRDFDESDKACMRLWRKLIELSAYADDAYSVLKDEIRPHYLAGLENGYPDVPMDWEEYWELYEGDDND